MLLDGPKVVPGNVDVVELNEVGVPVVELPVDGYAVEVPVVELPADGVPVVEVPLELQKENYSI